MKNKYKIGDKFIFKSKYGNNTIWFIVDTVANIHTLKESGGKDRTVKKYDHILYSYKQYQYIRD